MVKKLELLIKVFINPIGKHLKKKPTVAPIIKDTSDSLKNLSDDTSADNADENNFNSMQILNESTNEIAVVPSIHVLTCNDNRIVSDLCEVSLRKTDFKISTLNEEIKVPQEKMLEESLNPTTQMSSTLTSGTDLLFAECTKPLKVSDLTESLNKFAFNLYKKHAAYSEKCKFF